MYAFRDCFGFQKFAEQGEGELSTPGGRVDLGGWLVSHYDLSRKRKNIYIYIRRFKCQAKDVQE